MKTLKFGFKFYKKYLPLALIALVLGFCFIILNLLSFQLIQLIIDYVIIPTDPSAITEGLASTNGNYFEFLVNGNYGKPGTITLLINIIILSISMMATKHVLIYTRNNLHFHYGFKFEKTLRYLSFEKLLSSDNDVLIKYNTGDLLTILNRDIVLFKNLFIHTIPNIIDSVFFIILSIIFLYNIYPILALLPFIVIPFQLFAIINYIKKAKKINSNIRNASSDLSMNVQENINGIRIVRSFAAEDYEIKKFKKYSTNFKNTYFEQIKFTTKYSFIFIFIRHILYLACILTGTILVINGYFSIGVLISFIAYVFTILDHITNIVNKMFEFEYFTVCGEKLYDFIKSKNTIINIENPKIITKNPNIHIKNISLNINNQDILKNIDIKIPYGKKIGIMGNTGSGKTTLLKLLNRFTDPSKGGIFINNINLKDIDINNVRRQYSYVMQDLFLFSNTIDSNIAFYNNDISRKEIKKFAKLAEADSFINKLSNGYDTIVGERGIGLSGGQKQRLSIARAFLKNAPILLLDDVTSALDTETEKKLITNIFNNYNDKTIIITAHRASSVKECDEIIILENGKIIERGNHKDLINLKGKYSEIVKKQSFE